MSDRIITASHLFICDLTFRRVRQPARAGVLDSSLSHIELLKPCRRTTEKCKTTPNRISSPRILISTEWADKVADIKAIKKVFSFWEGQPQFMDLSTST